MTAPRAARAKDPWVEDAALVGDGLAAAPAVELPAEPPAEVAPTVAWATGGVTVMVEYAEPRGLISKGSVSPKT